MGAAADIHTRDTAAPLGSLLRRWRASRRMSQLELAMRAGFSARHVSFIETGRTQPSRQAVLVLAEALDVPLRERNLLLEAAGYARVYRHTPIASGEMTHIRGVLQFILDRHEPYGAVVLDRDSNVLMANRSSSRLFGALIDPSLLQPPANLLRAVFHPQGARRFIVNWGEVSRLLWRRVEHELQSAPDDEAGQALLRELREYLGDPSGQAAPASSTPASDLVLPVHVRTGAFELRLFSTIMTFGTPQDVTLQELRIETFFPADDASAEVWRGI